MQFIKEVSNFIDYDDIKMLRALAKDEVTISSIAKIFEDPTKAEKYFVLIKNKPFAIYMVAKISERISKYLNGKDKEICFKLFLDSMLMLRKIDDKAIRQKTFLLLKEAMDKRLKEKNLEELAILLSNFYDLGFDKYLNKLYFLVSNLAENGEFSRAARILSLIDLESAKKLRSIILVEWAKSLKGEEALKLLEVLEDDTLSVLAEVYESVGKYDRALEIYSRVDDYEMKRKMVEVLKDWSKKLSGDDAVEKLKKAFKLAVYIDDELADEVFDLIKEALQKTKEY